MATIAPLILFDVTEATIIKNLTTKSTATGTIEAPTLLSPEVAELIVLNTKVQIKKFSIKNTSTKMKSRGGTLNTESITRPPP